MSREPDRDKTPKDTCYSADPFTSLTKFIDECISYTLQSVIGLPSSKEDIRSWRPWEELQRIDKHPWGWGFDEKNQDRKAGDRSHHRHELNRQAPSRDTASTQHSDSSSEHLQRCTPSEALSRLENFLSFSRYSPTVLEADPELRHLRDTWRPAFTDLMNETHGGPLPYLTENRHLMTRQLDAEAWKSFFLMNFGYNFHINALRRDLTPLHAPSLLDPLSLAVYMKSAENMSSDISQHEQQYKKHVGQHHPELMEELDSEFQNSRFGCDHVEDEEGGEDEDQEGDGDGLDLDLDVDRDAEDDFNKRTSSTTELDMLEEMVKGLFADNSYHVSSAAVKQTAEQKSSDSKRPSIVGRMTRIERVIKPDGTVETRRILKTRFSDGTENEESSADVVVGQVRRDLVDDRLTSRSYKERTSTVETAKESNANGKNGWFWRRSNT